MRRASSLPKGGTRNVTSFRTSTKTPPRPNITTGPNNWSWLTPTTVSTPPDTCSETITPSASGAAFMNLLNTFLASSGELTPMRTRPRSALCRISGEQIFITTG